MDNLSPSVCDRCYRAWLDGSLEVDDFDPDCTEGCREAYLAWRDGGVGL